MIDVCSTAEGPDGLHDSPLERNGFEIPVPGFKVEHFYTAPELGAAGNSAAGLRTSDSAAKKREQGPLP
jgi:hypothetical protein